MKPGVRPLTFEQDLRQRRRDERRRERRLRVLEARQQQNGGGAAGLFPRRAGDVVQPDELAP